MTQMKHKIIALIQVGDEFNEDILAKGAMLKAKYIDAGYIVEWYYYDVDDNDIDIEIKDLEPFVEEIIWLNGKGD